MREAKMASRWIRGAVALAAAGGLAVMQATAAFANDEESSVSGNVDTAPGLPLLGTAKGDNWTATADIIHLYPHGFDGEALMAYCIDLETSLSTEYPYIEGEWAESNVPNLEFVRWILFNSYPNVTAEDLFKKVDYQGGANFNAQQAQKVAYAGTQAAIWHYTDTFQLNRDNPVKDGTAAEKQAVVKIYDHLINNTGSLPDPDSYRITLDNVENAVQEDDKFGPYIIRSNVGTVQLESEGGMLVDKSGKQIKSRSDGEEFYIVLDEDSSSIVIDGKASYDIPVGRVFLATTMEAVNSDISRAASKEESQKLILAEPRESDLPARWAFELDRPQKQVPPGEAGKLPVTGTTLTYASLGAGSMLAAGLAFLMLMKKRRQGDAVWE